MMGIVAGLPKGDMVSSYSGDTFLTVGGVSYKAFDTIPNLLWINLEGGLVDGHRTHTAFWHWQDRHGGPSITIRPTPFWVAVAVRLVETFGGRIDVFDSDDVYDDIVRPKPRGVQWDLDNDDHFWAMQRRLRRLEPVTMDDMLGLAVAHGLEFPEDSLKPEGVRLDDWGKVLDNQTAGV